ncbi:large-conductance mechanosensitive channel protein MscL [uncultured Gimesia sp.]|jgi:large conductance mechanosensitive channel|uniref:large-conductance mechanosensitive channel protein MscL n=1 Tax=uncultured Gimesia sp. TaxID=1678688 RepID=UPI002632AC26|nr:large-conductance mechanosensitive channel protein MscL [uncultured Gimesia sp.]
MSMIQEFKEFAMKGNVVDMAVGIVIGAAFGKIVTSFVSNIIMPPVGLLIGGVDFSNLALTLKKASVDEAGKTIEAVSINYGAFLNVVLDFIIVAFAIFIVIKAMNAAKTRFEKQEAAAPAAPAEPSAEIKLLTEIRDALQKS